MRKNHIILLTYGVHLEERSFTMSNERNGAPFSSLHTTETVVSFKGGCQSVTDNTATLGDESAHTAQTLAILSSSEIR